MANPVGTLHEDPTTFTTLSATTAAVGTLTLTEAPTLPVTTPLVTRFVSQAITATDVVGGTATQSIALTGEPAGSIPLACYVECYPTGGVTSSSAGSTSGLTVEVGTAGDPDGYLKSVSIFGATGMIVGESGVMIGSYRGADSLLLKLTATGGAPNVAHIGENLFVKVVVLYATAVTTW